MKTYHIHATVTVTDDGPVGPDTPPGPQLYVTSRKGWVFFVPLDFNDITSRYGFPSDDEDKYRRGEREATKIIEDMDDRAFGRLQDQ